jgi:L-amino acid N-acyltransferase YncA
MAIIRIAGEKDADALVAIYAPFCAESAVSFETEPPSRAEMARRIEATLEQYPWLVAEHQGQILGYAYANAHRQRAAYRWSVETSAYVDEKHRHKGLGRQLYGELFSLLKRQGFVNAFAGITLPNAASVGLHENIGFRALGAYKNVGYKAGAWHDVGWWQLDLKPHVINPDPPIAFRKGLPFCSAPLST